MHLQDKLVVAQFAENNVIFFVGHAALHKRQAYPRITRAAPPS